MGRRLKKATKPKTPAVVQPSVTWVSATVRPEEVYNPTKIAGRADLLVARAIGWAEICSHAIATHCSGQMLRLFRKSAGLNRNSKRYKAVNRKQAAFMRGERRDKAGSIVTAAASQSDFVEVLQHPVLDLLNTPNNHLRGSEWKYLRFKAQEIAGNAYAFLFADGAGVEIYPLEPQYVTVLSTTDNLIDKYRYSRNRYRWQDIDPSLVMHQRHRPSIHSPILGASPMEAVIQQLDLFEAATQAETARWMNGGSPNIHFKLPDGTTPEQIAEMEQRIQAKIRGVRKTGGNLFTSGGVEANVLGNPAKDMEYLSGMQEIKAIVWAAWDLPESEMRLNDANLASATAGNPQLMRRGVLPRINSDADALTQCLLPLYGLDPSEWWFAYDDPCIDDQVQSASMVKTLLDARAITVNEARTIYLDLPASVEDGADKLPVPPVPPSPFGLGGFGSMAPKPADKPETPKEEAAETPSDEAAEPVADDETAKAFDPVAFKARTFPKSGWHFQTHDHGHTHDTKAASEGPPVIPPSAQNAFDDLNRELEAWHAKAAKELADDPRGSRGKLEAELQAILDRHLGRVLAAGAMDMAATVGDSAATEAAKGAAEYLKSYVIDLRDAISKSFEADVQDAMRIAMNEGAGLAEAQRAVSDAIGEQASYRAERIARTETARAYGNGEVNAGAAAGWQKQLLAGPVNCPLCAGIQEQWPDPVPCDTVYYAVGDTVAGYTNDYADCVSNPFHPNCGCDVVLVAPDDAGGDA